MPDFSGVAAVLAEVTASALPFYLDKGEIHYQTIQEKPILRVLERSAKEYTGGSGDISVAVKGAFGNAGTNDALRGYQLDDQLTFYNPGNTRRAVMNWKEMHIGITFTLTEMKVDGLVFNDDSAVPGSGNPGSSAGFRRLSGRDRHSLTNMIQEKFEDMSEQYARSYTNLGYGDGVADAKAMAGIRAFITDNPTTGTVAGINRATAGNEFWRNRSLIGANAIIYDPANGGNLLQTLKRELRQLRRFGGRPNVALCGSDFIDALEREYRANGQYYMDGPSKGEVDLDLGTIRMGNLKFEYDPWLDDNSLTKRCFIWSDKDLFLMKMPGEWNRVHAPARPIDRMTVNRSITCTGQMVARRLNSAGTYAIA